MQQKHDRICHRHDRMIAKTLISTLTLTPTLTLTSGTASGTISPVGTHFSGAMAMGFNTTASGRMSTAMGYNTIARDHVVGYGWAAALLRAVLAAALLAYDGPEPAVHTRCRIWCETARQGYSGLVGAIRQLHGLCLCPSTVPHG